MEKGQGNMGENDEKKITITKFNKAKWIPGEIFSHVSIRQNTFVGNKGTNNNSYTSYNK